MTKTLLAAAVLLTLLSGCGDTADEPQVASLPPTATTTVDPVTTDPAATDAPPPAETETSQERPVLRVDDTEERRKGLWNAYNTCLLDHGAQEPPPGAMGIALGDVLVDYPGPKKAQEACRNLEPLQPPALDAATNPDFQDQAQEYVACLQDGGLYVERLNGQNLDWTYAEGHPVPDDSAETEQRCLVEVFGDA